MDNHMHSDRNALIVSRLMFDNLVDRDLSTMKPVPRLATSWRSLDPTTWELKLRDGVKFHGGEEFSAADVKFSIERVIKPEQKSPQRPNFTWVDRVDVVDPRTVHIKTKGPYPIIIERLTALSIMSEKYTKEKGDAYIAEHPNGTGPYRFVSWDRAKEAKLEINPSFWGQPAKIKQLAFRSIPEVSTQIAELMNSNVHLVRNIPPDQIDVINKSGKATVKSKPILRIVFLNFDGSGRASPSPFTKPEVRRAAYHAIDREAIVKNVLRGQGQVVNASVSPLQFGYDPNVKSYPYDPARAKALLQEAGLGSGFESDFFFYDDPDVAQSIAGFLGKVGITTRQKDYQANSPALTELRRAGKMKDMALQNWGSFSVFDADAILYTWFHSSSADSYNHTADMDKWLDEARTTLDEGRRKELYAKAQELIADQAFWVPLYARYTIEGVSNLLNYEVSSDEIMYLDLASWK